MAMDVASTVCPCPPPCGLGGVPPSTSCTTCYVLVTMGGSPVASLVGVGTSMVAMSWVVSVTCGGEVIRTLWRLGFQKQRSVGFRAGRSCCLYSTHHDRGHNHWCGRAPNQGAYVIRDSVEGKDGPLVFLSFCYQGTHPTKASLACFPNLHSII